MGYLIFNGLLLLYLLWDGYRRQASYLWAWALGVIIIGVLVLPFYFAKRPLREGEVRSGGFGWNVLKNFAILWTLLMIVIGIAAASGVGEVMQEAQTDAEQAGAVLGTGLGFGMLGCMWFIPMVGALIFGLFVKNSADVEEGPTGPLAEE